MKIIRYSVKKLFKTYDHEIDLSSDDQIKIILGQNGRGGLLCPCNQSGMEHGGRCAWL